MDNSFFQDILNRPENELFTELRTEYMSIQHTKEKELPKVIGIGEGLVKVDLASINEKVFPLWAINKAVIATARRRLGDEVNGMKDVAGMQAEENSSLMSPLKEEDIKHYRIISAGYVPLFGIISNICNALKQKGHIIVAIEGRAASGKTTATCFLDDIFYLNVIRTDDFILPEEMKTARRMEEAGGNFYYERFCEEVVPFIKGTKKFTYNVFDYKTQSYTKTVTVCPRPVTIVEGAYSCHPNIGNIYDLKIFMTIFKKEQNKRILMRNGEEGLKKFVKEWIPLENKYFENFSIREKCDIVLLSGAGE
ncbi:MAG: hypothetical protein MJ113_07160 [Lachnospiraceae bacterium]|nr:hypothetical protein [Lachnospiraceae bacterium]